MNVAAIIHFFSRLDVFNESTENRKKKKVYQFADLQF